MHMRGVEFPEQLIEAHRAGNLVIFVGAGASVAPPSSLPLFSKLAKDIAAEVHVGMSKEDEEHPDSFLGRLDRATDKRTVDVHAMVERHVDIPGSTPNRLHFAQEGSRRLETRGKRVVIPPSARTPRSQSVDYQQLPHTVPASSLANIGSPHRMQGSID